jgi:hypothetical protein
MRVYSWILLPVIAINQACGLILNIGYPSVQLKIICKTIFIAALIPMTFIFCYHIHFFNRYWLFKMTGERLSKL